MSRQVTEELFLKDVADHEMTVLMESGIYRHLRFQKPGTSVMYFDVVTWPGYLAYSGDMGSFVFARTADMLQFFRDDREKKELGINPHYWGEKLRATDREGKRGGGYKEYSEERLRSNIEDDVKAWIEDIEPYDANDEEVAAAKKKFADEIRKAVRDDVFTYIEDGEHAARQAVRDFKATIGAHTYEFHDSWEWSCDEYTYRFIWCCYALVWSIKKYDESKAVPA